MRQRLYGGVRGSFCKGTLYSIAKEMEMQFISLCWNAIDKTRESNPERGFGEELFRSQYLSELVNVGSSSELGEIGEAIYQNFVNKEDE